MCSLPPEGETSEIACCVLYMKPVRAECPKVIPEIGIRADEIVTYHPVESELR